MVSDQDIAKGVESLLRESDPNSIATLNGVVQQLEARLGLDLSHKAGFIRDQIDLLLRSHPQALPPHAPPPKDPFTLHHHPQFQSTHPHHFTSHFTLHPQPHPAQQPVVKADTFVQNAVTVTPEVPKESAPTGGKRRGGAGGLNKVCGVSPELQAIVGEPALPRTEIVKQLWAYIRKNNLQDPSNKRKIICDDALRVVFETDCTDMFKMNKLLAKHIIPLGPAKESQAKRMKVTVEPTTQSADPGSTTVIISEALANFLGTGEKEMQPSEPIRLVWEYIKVNHLEDPLNSMVILCDAKLQELLGCESISALGIQEMLARHHLFKRS
ncbi:Upstream activation factor subunit UAF30 [Senna tora]|uniref:Upstream activation factor subunit UAF30 n=1 Tax=Senna tora TaxID=362788 RepID=A0A834SHW8_9FABA|nr:Upstream activation factor subunit UAF30 [Senna tora]